MVTIYTIGHSNHPIERLVELLNAHQIAVLADVRSSAFSKYNPQFNATPLRIALVEAGLEYADFGGLGGKPANPAMIQPDGTPNYDKIEASPAFQQALRRLIDLAQERRVAMMCAEADPMACHRERLIAPSLRRAGIEVRHILADGTIAEPPAQGAFDF